MIIQADIKVEGYVQGVCFRSDTCEKATELNVAGWIKNESDGTVSICAQGKQPEINNFLEWCKTGPKGARPTNITISIKQNPDKLLTGFEIAY
jgi:acylphosphatase